MYIYTCILISASTYLYILFLLSFISFARYTERLAKTPHVLPNSVPEIRLQAKLHIAHASSSAQLLEGSCKIDQLKI